MLHAMLHPVWDTVSLTMLAGKLRRAQALSNPHRTHHDKETDDAPPSFDRLDVR